MAEEKKMSPPKDKIKYVTYGEHKRSECEYDLKKSYNKKHGLYITCRECNCKVLKINSNPTKVQQYDKFAEEINQLKTSDDGKLQDKYNLFINTLLELYDDKVDTEDENYIVQIYDQWFAPFYKSISEEPEFAWYFKDNWTEEDKNWDEFATFNREEQDQFENLSKPQKNIINTYINEAWEKIKDSCYPEPLHLLGWSLHLSHGATTKVHDTNRHFDQLYNGIPWIFCLHGQYESTPGGVANKIRMKAGTSYQYVSWKFHNKRHGYIIKKGMLYMDILMYQMYL